METVGAVEIGGKKFVLRKACFDHVVDFCERNASAVQEGEGSQEVRVSGRTISDQEIESLSKPGTLIQPPAPSVPSVGDPPEI
jgi:hypothetical protein